MAGGISLEEIRNEKVDLVYLTLCCALGAFAVGAYLHILMNIGGFLTILGIISGIVWLLSTRIHYERKKFGILMGIALLQGANVGSLIQCAIEFDPSILVSAFGGTALAFGCLSAIAALAKRTEFLYLGGPLSYGLSIVLLLRFASSIFGSTATLSFELYFGLIILLGYVVFDTQAIIVKAHHGYIDHVKLAWIHFVVFIGILVRMQSIIGRAHLVDLDYVKHARVLFVDFIGILVRILVRTLVVMIQNSNKLQEKKKKWRS